MSITRVRAHKRYALRSNVEVHGTEDDQVKGLLIELSAESARVSSLGAARLTPGQSVAVRLETGRELSGRIRWAHGGIAGVKLDPPLYPRQLAEVLASTRDEGTALTRHFGT